MSDIGSGQVGVVVTKLEGRGPLNLLGRDTFLGLNAELDRLDQDRSVRAIILTGSGDRAVSAGKTLRQRTLKYLSLNSTDRQGNCLRCLCRPLPPSKDRV